METRNVSEETSSLADRVTFFCTGWLYYYWPHNNATTSLLSHDVRLGSLSPQQIRWRRGQEHFAIVDHPVR